MRMATKLLKVERDKRNSSFGSPAWFGDWSRSIAAMATGGYSSIPNAGSADLFPVMFPNKHGTDLIRQARKKQLPTE